MAIDEYSLEDLALDIECLESFNELINTVRVDEEGNKWLDTTYSKFVEASDDLKELTSDIIKGLRSHLVTQQGHYHTTNRVKFVHMGFRMTVMVVNGVKFHHVIRLSDKLTNSSILLKFA